MGPAKLKVCPQASNRARIPLHIVYNPRETDTRALSLLSFFLFFSFFCIVSLRRTLGPSLDIIYQPTMTKIFNNLEK